MYRPNPTREHHRLYEEEPGWVSPEFKPIGEPDYDRVDEELQAQLRNPEMWEGPMEEQGRDWL